MSIMRDPDCDLYVIAKKSGNILVSPVKVGISGNCTARLRSIQTACPFQIDIAYVFECMNREAAVALEASFHQTQTNARLHGEWFDFDPVQAIHLICIAFRVLLEKTAPPELHEDILFKAGVQWAEKRFGLNIPHSALQ